MESLTPWLRSMLWPIVGAYFAAWLVTLVTIIFGKRWKTASLLLCLSGVILNTGWLLLRWRETGHGPYLNLYEVAPSVSVIAILLFLVAQHTYPVMYILAVFILPSVFSFLAIGAFSNSAPVALAPILDSSWLVVHVITAKLTLGSYLISAVLAIAYLLKHHGDRRGKILDRFPSNPINEELNRKFVTLGFLNHSVMLVSGSIWAHVAFGSYWSWDPIETWSLISWLIYGIYYHLITVHAWQGCKMAWISLLAMLSILCAFFLVPYVFTGSHNLFL